MVYFMILSFLIPLALGSVSKTGNRTCSVHVPTVDSDGVYVNQVTTAEDGEMQEEAMVGGKGSMLQFVEGSEEAPKPGQELRLNGRGQQEENDKDDEDKGPVLRPTFVQQASLMQDKTHPQTTTACPRTDCIGVQTCCDEKYKGLVCTVDTEESGHVCECVEPTSPGVPQCGIGTMGEMLKGIRKVNGAENFGKDFQDKRALANSAVSKAVQEAIKDVKNKGTLTTDAQIIDVLGTSSMGCPTTECTGAQTCCSTKYKGLVCTVDNLLGYVCACVEPTSQGVPQCGIGTMGKMLKGLRQLNGAENFGSDFQKQRPIATTAVAKAVQAAIMDASTVVKSKLIAKFGKRGTQDKNKD